MIYCGVRERRPGSIPPGTAGMLLQSSYAAPTNNKILVTKSILLFSLKLGHGFYYYFLKIGFARECGTLEVKYNKFRHIFGGPVVRQAPTG